jgi:hypothetical protein
MSDIDDVRGRLVEAAVHALQRERGFSHWHELMCCDGFAVAVGALALATLTSAGLWLAF